MAEREPQDYKFKHNKQISLEQYRGIASDIMELNNPITDGFMETSDMRGDIVIVQKPNQRVMDYDGVGNVRVTKNLQMPRLDLRKGNNASETERDDDGVWFIAVNDQALADEVARDRNLAGNGKNNFDERFVVAFRAEVNKGLKTCLKREKLLNSGNYNYSFIVAYLGTSSWLYPSIITAKNVIDGNPVEALAKYSRYSFCKFCNECMQPSSRRD